MSEQNASQAAAAAVSGASPDEVIAERGRTHGDYGQMSEVQAGLVRILTTSPGWAQLRPTIQVFLLAVAQKLSRIVSGNPAEPDHYRDIGGYARLAEKSLEPTFIDGGYIASITPDRLLVGGSEIWHKSSVAAPPAEIVEAVVNLQKATESLYLQINLSNDEKSRSRGRIADNAIREIVAAIGRQVDKGRAEISKLHEEKLRSYSTEIMALNRRNDELQRVIEGKDRVINRLVEG
jgi:hypothetical protein